MFKVAMQTALAYAVLRRFTRLTYWLLVAALLLVLVACTPASGGVTGGASAVLQRLRPLVQNCHGPVAAYVGWDLSASSRNDPVLQAQRLSIVEGEAAQVAACTGAIEVVGFAHAITDTVVLGQAEFPKLNGTETARLLAANKTLVDLDATVHETLSKAVGQLAPKGTDILGTLYAAAQYGTEHPGAHLQLVVLTDGLQTGSGFGRSITSVAQARRAADDVRDVPVLKGAAVHLTGIGHVRGRGSAQPSTALTLAVSAYWQRLCIRTQAASCLVTTS